MATVQRVDQGESSARRHSSSTGNLDRLPPCDLDAEIGVLGSILIWPDACDEVALRLRPVDFYDPPHEILFRHMLAIHERGRKIDPTLLADELKKAGQFEAAGGSAHLARLAQAVPTATNATYYAEIVAEKSTCRELIRASMDILSEAYDSSDDPAQLVSRAEQRIFAILDERGSSEIPDIADVLQAAMQRIDARMKGEHATGGVETGFTDLDSLLGGLHNSELVILAARPSMGKTALAMNIAEHVALISKVPTLFVSLEMSSLELIDRMLCSVSRVNGHRLRNGTISNDDRQRLVEKAGEISSDPFFIDDSPSRSVTEIAAVARRIKRRNNDRLGLIVIDYLQLIEPDNSRDPRQEQVAKIARRLKGLAREMKVPVLCLAQLNRQAEANKGDHRPKLSHLRESGAIEQDADVVMFIHREEYYQSADDREQHAGEAVLIVSKQRNGPTGDVPLTWKREYTRFENAAIPRDDSLAEFSSDPGGF